MLRTEDALRKLVEISLAGGLGGCHIVIILMLKSFLPNGTRRTAISKYRTKNVGTDTTSVSQTKRTSRQIYAKTSKSCERYDTSGHIFVFNPPGVFKRWIRSAIVTYFSLPFHIGNSSRVTET